MITYAFSTNMMQNISNAYNIVEDGYEYAGDDFVYEDAFQNVIVGFRKGDEFVKLFFPLSTVSPKQEAFKIVDICSNAYDKNWKKFRLNIMKRVGDWKNYNQK